MRPNPVARHLLAIALFAVTSSVYGYLAFHDKQGGTSAQAHIVATAMKDSDPHLFPHDPVFGPGNKWHMNSPILQGMLKLVFIPAGYDDPLLPFRMMTGMVAMLYLVGMYALLYQQTRSWSVSVYVAIISTAVMETLPRLTWGFGALEATDPAALCLATMPLVLLAYLHYEKQWRLALVFAFVGLLANVHLTTAMNLAAVLAGVHLVRGRFRLRCMGMVLVCGLAAAAAALPYVWYLLALRSGMATGAAAPDYRLARDALNLADMRIFYSEMPKSLLEWRLMAALAALGIPGALVLMRVERYRVRNREMWIWLIAIPLVVGFGLHGCSQLIGKWTNTAPPVIGFVQALRLLLLPLFVLLAQGLTNVFRLARYRHVVQWLCVIGAVVWMLPSPNLRVARLAAMEAATSFMDARERPAANVRRHRDRDQQRAELVAIAQWARKNTSNDTVFLTDDPTFRMLSRRSIFASRDDLPYFYVLTPQELADWLPAVRDQSALFNRPVGGADAQDVVDLITALPEDPNRAGVDEWYILLDKGVTFESPGALEPVAVQDGARWRQLYRVRLPDAE